MTRRRNSSRSRSYALRSAMSSRPSLALVVMCSLLGDAVGPRDKRHGVHGLAAGLLDDAAVGEVAVARHHVPVGLAVGGGHLLRSVASHLLVLAIGSLSVRESGC